MIKNSYISLAPDSTARNDAVNSIRYTLLLNYKVPSKADSDDLILAVKESCQNCCEGLFKDALSSSKICFNFFGLPSIELSPDTYELRIKNLSYLENYPLNKWDYHDIDPLTGFPSMILDHCIFSTYHAILTDLLNDVTVTGYRLKNQLKDSGFYSLYKSKKYDPCTAKFFNVKNGCSIVNSKRSSQASDFNKNTKTHLKALSYLSDSFFTKSSEHQDQSSTTYRLQFSGLFFRICDTNAGNWKFFSSLADKSINQNCDTKKLIENFNDLADALFTKTTGPSSPITNRLFSPTFGSVVDDLYYCFIHERLFNTNLIYSLFRNIHYIESNTPFKLCQNEILTILGCCQDLPNIFSRQCFLKYAFGQCITKPYSYIDFWHDHPIYQNNQAIEGMAKNQRHFQFTKWLEQFESFCKYMAHYVIPIYEWCFTCLLMDSIEAKYPEGSHKDHLVNALNELAAYIEQNFERILRPIKSPGNQDELDVITKHKTDTVYLDCFSNDTLLQFFTKFQPASTKGHGNMKERDLNLTLLNPDFFRHYEKDKFVSSESRIRDFYINLTQFLN